MPRYDVVGVGSAACDYRVRLERFPGPDEKVRAEELIVSGGGTVGTALVAVARLGYKAAWAGVLGDDDFGRFILADLEREGIDTAAARVVHGARSPFAFCAAHGRGRSVVSVRPTTPPLEVDGAMLDRLLDTWFVHLDGKEPALARELAREARKRGVGVSLDLQRLEDGAEGLLEHADLAMVSEAFLGQLMPGKSPEEAVRALWRSGMHLAGVTLGARGVVASAGGEPFTIPAEPIDAVDSTGAGDAFHGALLVGLLHGQSLRQALRLACHVAAMSCLELGRGSLPHRDEVGDWL